MPDDAPPPPPIELVVFDLGGVLVQASRTFQEAWAATGLPPAAFVHHPAFVEAQLRIVTDLGTGRIDVDTYCALVAAESGGEAGPTLVRRVLDAWCQPEYPEAGRVIDALEAASVRTALLSNTNQAHWDRLIGTGEPHHHPEYPTVLRIQHRFASHLVRLGKPDPAIYALVEAETGVPASRILYFDDVAEYVAAARALGWRAEQVDHTRLTAPQLLGHLRTHRVI